MFIFDIIYHFISLRLIGRAGKEQLSNFAGRTVKCVMSEQQPWTIILLVYVGSIVDLISLTNTNGKRSRDRNNVELRFFGWPNQPSSGRMRICIGTCLKTHFFVQ